MRRHLLAVSLAAVSLAGCSSLNPFASTKPVPTPLTVPVAGASLSVDWQVNVGDAGTHVFAPAVVGDSVYAAAEAGRVVRIDEGRVVWSTEVGEPLSAGVGSDGNLVAVAGQRGRIVVLDARTGALRFAVPLLAEVGVPPVIAGDVVVVRTVDSRLIGLSAEDGSQRWVYQRTMPPLALRQFSPLLVDNKIVVAGYPGGRLAAINATNGGLLWNLTVAIPRGATELERVADVVGPPVLAGRSLCAVSYQGRLACFDPTSGRTRWSTAHSSATGLDHDGERLFVTSDADVLAAFAVEDGQTLWRVEGMRHRALTRPLAVGEFVAVGDVEGYVHLFAAQSGKALARLRLDASAVKAPPARLPDGRLIVQTQSGGLHALSVR